MCDIRHLFHPMLQVKSTWIVGGKRHGKGICAWPKIVNLLSTLGREKKPSSARREIIKNKNNIIVNTPSTKLKWNSKY